MALSCNKQNLGVLSMVRTLSGEPCTTVSLSVQERLFPDLFCSKLICLNAQEIKKPDFVPFLFLRTAVSLYS